MQHLFRSIGAAAVALMAVGLAGCLEDELEVRLNADGSGWVKHKATWSERMVVASAERAARPKTLPMVEEGVREKIASALAITKLEFADLPDGGKTMYLEGTFDSASQFFLSEYSRETCNLRLTLAGPDKVAVSCAMGQSKGSMELTTMYGLAKGLYVKRTVHLPADVIETNGQLAGGDKKTVTWVFDLRNQEGLKRTQAFIEGPDEGKGVAVIPASALTFALPLEPTSSTEPPSTQPGAGSLTAADLPVDVSWIAWKKVKPFEESTGARKSDLTIGLKLTWPEGKRPAAYYPPVLTHLTDDCGKDLVSDKHTGSGRRKIHEHTKKQQMQVSALSPSPEARHLQNLAGTIKVVTDLEKQTVILDNVSDLVGKDSTGVAVLDDFQFRIKSAKGSQLTVAFKPGSDRISSLTMIKDDGTKLKNRGGGGSIGGGTYDSHFSEPLSDVQKCEIEVIVSKTTVTVPFSAGKLELP